MGLSRYSFLQASASGSSKYSDTYDGLQLFLCIFRGVGQVFLADNLWSGVVILIGLGFCSRISACFAFLGSFLGMTVALALGAPLPEIQDGLWGYNAVLASMAIGGMFYIPNAASSIMAGACAILATLLFAPIRNLLNPYPAMTFPFCFAAIVFVLMQGSSSLTIPIELHTITTPEGHIRRRREMQKAT